MCKGSQKVWYPVYYSKTIKLKTDAKKLWGNTCISPATTSTTNGIAWGAQGHKILRGAKIPPPSLHALLFFFCFVTARWLGMCMRRTCSHLVLNEVVLVLVRLAHWGRKVEWLCMCAESRVPLTCISWLVGRRRRGVCGRLLTCSLFPSHAGAHWQASLSIHPPCFSLATHSHHCRALAVV